MPVQVMMSELQSRLRYNAVAYLAPLSGSDISVNGVDQTLRLAQQLLPCPLHLIEGNLLRSKFFTHLVPREQFSEYKHCYSTLSRQYLCNSALHTVQCSRPSMPASRCTTSLLSSSHFRSNSTQLVL